MFKKIIAGLFFFTIATPAVFAAIQAPTGSRLTAEQKDAITQKQQQVENNINQNYDAFKAALLKRIDKAISMIDATTQEISANTQISDASKQAILDSLAKTKKGLTDYRIKAAGSTSLDELKAINQSVTQYLKDNKDVIKKSIQDTISIVGGEMVKKSEAYEQKLMATLEVLKKTCPSETAAIGSLESDIAKLNSEIAALKQATQGRSSAEIKKITAEIKDTVKEASTILSTLETTCKI